MAIVTVESAVSEVCILAIEIVNFPIKVVIFHSNVSSPEGKYSEDPL